MVSRMAARLTAVSKLPLDLSAYLRLALVALALFS